MISPPRGILLHRLLTGTIGLFFWSFAIVVAEGVEPDKGRTVYEKNCIVCHGPQGKGDGPVAGDLTPKPANLTNEKAKNKQDDELIDIIRNGRPGTSMPAWKGDLSEQDMMDVLAYVRTLGQ